MRRKREVTYFGRAPILAGALALAWLERLLVDSTVGWRALPAPLDEILPRSNFLVYGWLKVDTVVEPPHSLAAPVSNCVRDHRMHLLSF